MKTIFRAAALAALLPSLPLFAQPIAFPGAEGFGKYSTGGRGGQVVEVTNLDDDGTGSFRAALTAFPGEPITIVFRVSGIIDLKSELYLKRSNVTIAGQTAPGDGICLRGGSFILNGARALSQGGNHGNIVIRHIRSRPGAFASSGVYGFDMENCHNVIVDHCSFSWANEECAALYDTKNTTVQWCVVSEGLYNAGHLKGVRSYGGVWGGQYASYHHNLIAHQQSRTVRFNGARAHDTMALVDYRNNVIYNWGSSGAAYGGEMEIQGGRSQVNIIGNYYKNGPATEGPLKFITASYTATSAKAAGEWHLSGNVMYGSTALTASNSAGADISAVPASWQPNVLAPIPFHVGAPVPEQTAYEAYDAVLGPDGAGATRPHRDSTDIRVVRETLLGTVSGRGSKAPGIIDSPSQVKGWASYDTYDVPDDSDHDGMPDTWEAVRGLNPSDAADRNGTNLSGGYYTNLEVYLNSQAGGATLGVPGPSQPGIITLYPNPAATSLHLELAGAGAPSVVRIADIRGHTLASYDLAASATFLEIPVHTLPAGMYILRVESAGLQAATRFVKQ